MASSRTSTGQSSPFKQQYAGLTDLYVIATMYHCGDSGRDRVNPYALVHTIWLTKVKLAVCQKNGMVLPPSAQTTFQTNQIAHPKFYAAAEELESIEKVQYDANGKTLPASKKSLEADAKRKNISQSELLAQNMLAAKQTKPLGHVDAHHIVSARAKGALPSRTLLYGWGIGINDVDNGVFLPRNKKVLMIDPLLTKAIKHSVVHTAVYHLAVFNELRQAPPVDSNAGRARLNDIKQDLIDGTFPYRKDDLP